MALREDGDYDKLVPPEDVIEAELSKSVEGKVRAAITERILREAGLDNQVATALRRSRSRAGARSCGRHPAPF